MWNVWNVWNVRNVSNVRNVWNVKTKNGKIQMRIKWENGKKEI